MSEISSVPAVGPALPEKSETRTRHGPEEHEPRPSKSTTQSADTTKVELRIDRNEKDRIIFKVIDEKSGKVVREIPPEEIRRLTQRMDEYIGNLVDMMG